MNNICSPVWRNMYEWHNIQGSLLFFIFSFCYRCLLFVPQRTVIQKASRAGKRPAPAESKCWKPSCEHIAFSVMWRFLGSSQELFLFFPSPSFLVCRRLPLTCTRLHSACIWKLGRRATWPHATINDTRFWQAAQWLCRLGGGLSGEEKPPGPFWCRSPPQSSVEGPRPA